MKWDVNLVHMNKVADTIIELELTANRGDCLSVYGVARDLSAALDIDIKPFEYKQAERMKLGIAREAEIHSEGEMDADLCYKLATLENLTANFMLQLRLAMVKVEAEGKLAKNLAYVTHTTGVILRVYDSAVFTNAENKVVVNVQANEKGLVEVLGNGTVVSIAGIYQPDETKATDVTTKLLLEASYIDPDILVEAFSQSNLKSDDLYYKTSRGSNPDLEFGLLYFAFIMDQYTDINCYEGVLSIRPERKNEKILVDAEEISSIVGMEIDSSKIVTILQKLDFDITISGSHVIAVTVPLFRHDIKHIQDIAEEIVRIIGINNIKSKPFVFAEQPRLNATTDRYKAKKSFRNRAVGAGFYENVSYVFSDRTLLEKYGFSTVEEDLELANPIAEELNTLRSTVLVNLLNAVKRNVSYSKKSIALFEIGAIFGSKREQSEVISFVISGQLEGENVANVGKPETIDFANFTRKVGAVVGTFELVPCTAKNGLNHPYQSADIVVGGKVCGFLSKLHPTVAEDFGIPDTFIAELDFDALLPKHINAKPISKFQGVYKDLSVVIDKSNELL